MRLGINTFHTRVACYSFKSLTNNCYCLEDFIYIWKWIALFIPLLFSLFLSLFILVKSGVYLSMLFTPFLTILTMNSEELNVRKSAELVFVLITCVFLLLSVNLLLDVLIANSFPGINLSRICGIFCVSRAGYFRKQCYFLAFECHITFISFRTLVWLNHAN